MTPTKKKILLVNGHPWKESFCEAIARTYGETIVSDAEIQVMHLRELDIDFSFLDKSAQSNPKFSAVKKCQDQVLWADHLVFVFPTWWSNMPSILTGYIAQVFASGVTFRYQSGSPLPEQLLKGKTARIFVTMDAPAWYNKWFNHAPQTNSLKKGVLEFCGVKPVKVVTFDRVRYSTEEKRRSWLEMVKQTAERDLA